MPVLLDDDDVPQLKEEYMGDYSELVFSRIASYKGQFKSCVVTVVHGSIVDFRSPKGVIVNSASNDPSLPNPGGVNKAIRDAGGESFMAASLKLKYNPADEGPVLLGPSTFGSLMVSFIIQAAGPDFRKVDRADSKATKKAKAKLAAAYIDSLNLAAAQEDIKQTIFPVICGGTNGGIKRVLALRAIRKWIDQNDVSLDDIILCSSTWDQSKEIMNAGDLVFRSTKGCVA